jgi:adenylate cyclase
MRRAASIHEPPKEAAIDDWRALFPVRVRHGKEWRVATSTAARKRSRRRFVELAAICLVVALLGWFVFPRVPYIIVAEWNARDRVINLGHRADLGKEFVFLAIDESSLRLDQLWPEDLAASPTLAMMSKGFPWSRAVYADAITRILDSGARLVMLDLIFDRPRDGDAELKHVLDKYRNRVVLVSNYSVNAGDPTTPTDDVPTLTTPAATLIENPETDPRVGYANFWAGAGEVVREAVYSTTLSECMGKSPKSGERVYRSLAGAAMHQLGKPDPSPGRQPLYFRLGADNSIPQYSFHALFVPYEWKDDLHSGAVLKDKIVMIGPSATRLQDFHLTSIGKMAGPLLHVNALNAALHRSFYHPTGEAFGAALVLAAAVVALTISWQLRRKPVLAFASLLGSAAAYLLLAFLISESAGSLFHIVRPLAVLGLSGTAGIAWNFARERRESGRTRSMLERYVSRNLVREVLDNRDDFLSALGGTRQPVTVFFSDVRGFTTFSEQRDAHSVVDQLNEYLGEMVGVIFRHEGTVDKFMGDGIMAVWGNVVSHGPAADAAQAVNAALEMLERLASLNQRWAERDLPPFAVGIGLHHGEAVFANIGSAEKMDPTVIGDTVNLASRVEGLTKKYGLSLCLTHPLAELVADRFLFRSVDLVQVVGKSRPVEIVTVIGRHGDEIPTWIKDYEGGVADFRARRFVEAIEQFRRSLEIKPEDKLIRLYLARCEAFIANPPPEDWTGTEIATSK